MHSKPHRARAVGLREHLAMRLAARHAAGLGRVPDTIEARAGVHVTVEGMRLVNFGSNDYLGLATCPDWQRTVADCHVRHAPSASSSRLVTGNLQDVAACEAAFAEHFGYAECLFLPSGYQANLAIVAGLLNHAGTIAFDRRIHASMAHALRGIVHDAEAGCGPLPVGYPHGDLAGLDRKLSRKARSGDAAGVQPVILTESLFSMDGDLLDVAALHAVAHRHGAFTIVDEAHAVGALGREGVGVAGHAAVRGAGGASDGAFADTSIGADIIVGTLGKAFGLSGAFVLMPEGFGAFLSNFASPVIHSTAVSPAMAASARAGLERVADMDRQREHLAALSVHLRHALTETACPVGRMLADAGVAVHGAAHILAVEVGDATRAVRLARALRTRGQLVFAARHPTVPEGRACLRISLTAGHGHGHVARLADALADVLPGCLQAQPETGVMR